MALQHSELTCVVPVGARVCRFHRDAVAQRASVTTVAVMPAEVPDAEPVDVDPDKDKKNLEARARVMEHLRAKEAAKNVRVKAACKALAAKEKRARAAAEAEATHMHDALDKKQEEMDFIVKENQMAVKDLHGTVSFCKGKAGSLQNKINASKRRRRSSGGCYSFTKVFEEIEATGEHNVGCVCMLLM